MADKNVTYPMDTNVGLCQLKLSAFATVDDEVAILNVEILC